MEKKPSKEIEVTNADRDVSAIKALAKLLPGGIGEAFLQFNQGKYEEAKQRRRDQVLEEVLERLTEQEQARAFESEDFANFYSKAKDPISNATNKDKRDRFRDLLLNSMRIPPGDPAWEESLYCLEMLQLVQPAGLYLLAQIERARQENKWIALEDFTPNKITILSTVGGVLDKNGIESIEPAYGFALIEKAARELKNNWMLIKDEGLVAESNGTVYTQRCLGLTNAGDLLVRWTKADF